jgi:hypothetical protein
MVILTMVDATSKIDLTSRLDKTQARKLVSEFFNKEDRKVSFTKHAIERMAERNMDAVDIENVLRSGNIFKEPEEKNGKYSYELETNTMSVVIGLRSPDIIVIISVWRE